MAHYSDTTRGADLLERALQLLDDAAALDDSESLDSLDMLRGRAAAEAARLSRSCDHDC